MEFRDKRVLIVGAGNSGVDIACDAARHADHAFLSVRRGYRYVPKHIGGLPTDAVLNGYLDPPKGMSLSGDANELIDALVGDLTRLGLPAPDHDALASHPIMNNQVLHHLAHGDLVAKPDVDRLTSDGVVFNDGSFEQIDVVLLATGYEYQVPFIDRRPAGPEVGSPAAVPERVLPGGRQPVRAGLHRVRRCRLQAFRRDGAAGADGHPGPGDRVHRDELLELKSADRPDLSGGIDYIDSPRHANYVESHAYQEYLAELRDRFEWPDIDEDTYDDLRQIAPTPAADGTSPSETRVDARSSPSSPVPPAESGSRWLAGSPTAATG